MNQTTFVRKVIYLACIGALLIPLSLISRPASRPGGGQTVAGNSGEGGQLAQLRDRYNLSQAKLMEIDPASETMKLASVGLRGVAVNMLWMQAMKHRKEQNWDSLRSTLNALIKIQPNFIKVWEYQAHNLSYNISVEFDDYEYRYHWVKQGIQFLTEGIPYNYRNHRITDNLGWFTGQKIGRSDEKVQFRRLFRLDNDFHEFMNLGGKGVDPDLYDTREYGRDNWKMAYQWYEKSRELVAKYGEQYTNDMMFYRKRPMQLMNQARGLEEEFEADEIMQEIWRNANEEWTEFGQQEIRSTTGLPITFEGLAEMETQLSRARRELDELVPGYRDSYMEDVRNSARLTDVQLAALDVPADQRSEEEEIIAAAAEAKIQKSSAGVDRRIAENANPDDIVAARRIAQDIDRIMARMRFVESYSETVNYKYWSVRSETEARDSAIAARQAMFRAEDMKRNSIFDDEFLYDPTTGEKTLKKKGAITLFEEAFDKWNEVLEDPEIEGEELVDGEIVEDLMDSAGEYWDMLRITGQPWPENFVFQYFIDARAIYDEDGLPTSQDVQDRISGRTEIDPNDPEQAEMIKKAQEEVPLPPGVEERSKAAAEDKQDK